MASKALTAEEKREAHMSLLYRNFVPAKVTCFDPATLVDPTFDPDEEHEKYRTKLTDKELFEACGGRTAHKGARSTVSGKLARVDPDKLLNGKGAATGRNGDSSSEDEFEIRARMIAEEMEGRPARKPKSAPVRVPSPSQSESSGEQVVPERWARQPASTVNVVPVVDVKDADDVVGNAESDDDEPARAAPVKERKEKKKDKRRSEDAKDDDESDAAKKERRRKRKEEKRKQKEAHKAEEASADVETESREERRRRKEEKRWKKKEAV